MKPASSKNQSSEIINNKQSLSVGLDDFAERLEPQRILVCSPQYFNVVDAKNPFMEGNKGKVDLALAGRQWQDLLELYKQLGREVEIIDGAKDLEDMVFCANQFLPFASFDGTPQAVLSRMRHPSRRREVPHFAQWLTARGYVVQELASDDPEFFFEGQGDAIWHPGKRLLWGGWGWRSGEAAYEQISEIIDAPAVTLRLVNDKYYHLDTCFCPLDSDTVMLFPAAFDETGLELVRHFFKNVIEVPEKDAANFALNALVLDRHVILQKGSDWTNNALLEHGFNAWQVDTSEFMKSGGSVFCMKMMIY